MTGSDARDALRSRPLRIGISTRALFDLEREHAVFEREGVHAYAALQRSLEGTPLAKGTGFQVIERLLALNEAGERPSSRSSCCRATHPTSR